MAQYDKCMSRDDLSLLMVSSNFQFRGSSVYTLRLAERLPEYGFVQSIVCPGASTVDLARRKALGIEVLPYLEAPAWKWVVLELYCRKLLAHPPDLIHIQSRTAMWHGEWIARRLNRPYVLTVHDYLQSHEFLQPDLTLCRRIITVSESVKAALVERSGLPEDLFVVIPCGVPRASDEDKSLVLKSGKVPVVGTAGPLEAVKGFPFFLAAAAHVLGTHRDVEFLIAGAGPEETSLRKLARTLGIHEHVTFVPNLLDFSDALSAMDIFCLPSLQQGIGTIMLEAMAMGRPVIATSVGGVFNVVRDNQTGLLVPPSDSVRLAERIIELLTNPELARRIGAAAMLEAETEFNVEHMVEATVEVYREVLDERMAGLTTVAIPQLSKR